jgi:hypothetical protein
MPIESDREHPMKIYYAADIHLGRRRPDGRLPDEDSVAAFRFIAEEANIK